MKTGSSKPLFSFLKQKRPNNYSYGWYEASLKPMRIKNVKSNQFLTLKNINVMKLTHTVFSHWHAPIDPDLCLPNRYKYKKHAKEYEFLYKDHEIQETLYIDIVHGQPFGLSCYIFYDKIFPKNVNYGVWRRIDDFIIDALLSMRSLFGDDSFDRVNLRGMFVNGQWNPNTRRTVAVGLNPTHSEIKVIAEPILCNLLEKPPLSWRYVDNDNFENDNLLNFTIDEKTQLRFIPKDGKIAGFQGRIPYFVREDDKAYIFLKNYSVGRGYDAEAFLYHTYTYIDQNVFFDFGNNGHYVGSSLAWVKNFGVRELYYDERYLNKYPNSEAYEIYNGLYGWLPYFLWINMCHVISTIKIDGIFKTKKIEIKHALQIANFQYLTVMSNFPKNIEDGYCGGIPARSYRLKSEIFKNEYWAPL